MKDEIAKVIAMLQEGKINSDEAGELISALKEEEAPASTENYLNKMFKVRISSETRDNVNVNIPIKLVKTLLKMGHGIASNIPQASKYAEDIDVDLILKAIDNEIDGKIVDVKSSNGDIVAVYIE
ncbi:hypothetical protein JOC34_001949 [Virgibacillus halotolerans]|uniref:SHOCT-like domain-containing protein n=1 Tax=Virgibacillus halotolerans TaxID=1071053 RepID=UPI0019602C70|nr:hypothetical protein [Virgibacillus halotolerans]MBM7599581.1 hypothetical protein [Virgibacillus halotolerans]